MTRMVNCVKLGKEAEGLAMPPYPGELGQKIFATISREAWEAWLGQQTILMNEHRLTPINPEHRKFLEQQMQNYLFGEGVDLPEQFQPPT